MLPRRPAGIIRSPIDVDHRLDGRGLVELDRGSHSSPPVGTRLGTRLVTGLIKGVVHVEAPSPDGEMLIPFKTTRYQLR